MRRVTVSSGQQACIECGESRPLTDFHKSTQYISGHRTTCKPCRKKEAATYFRRNRAGKLAKQKTAVQEYKRQCLAEYGSTCRCCGETELSFLSLDHIFDNGRHEKRGFAFYLELKRTNYPRKNELQVLCMNCQLGKRINGGFCPHHPETDLRIPLGK